MWASKERQGLVDGFGGKKAGSREVTWASRVGGTFHCSGKNRPRGW